MPPAVKDPANKMMARARVASVNYYSTNAHDVQARKLVTGILAGKRKPTHATLAKYGLKLDKNGQLVIPDELKPSPKISVVIPPPQEVTVKAVPEVIEHPKQMKEGPVTTDDIQKYFLSPQYQEDRKARGEKELKSTKQYATGAGIFIKLGLVKDKSQDVMPVIRNSDLVIKTIQERDSSKNTQTKDFQWVYTVCNQVPQIKQQIPLSLIKDVYGKHLGAGNKELKDSRYDALTEKSVYKWTDVVNGVKKTFGKDSQEYLFFEVFQEVPVRSELADIKVIQVKGKGKEVVPEKENVIVMNGKNATIYLNNYKTDRFYGRKEYHLSERLASLITKSLREEPRTKLIDMDTGIEIWLRTVLDEAGFPWFPYGRDTTDSELTKLVAGLRHTFASFANSEHNKGQFPKERKLADMMLHDVEQSHLSYRNKSFFTPNDIRTHKREADKLN